MRKRPYLRFRSYIKPWAVGRGGQRTAGDQSRMKVKDFTEYDRDKYLAVCSGEYLRPHTILDINKGLGEREERLITLVQTYIAAREVRRRD